MQAVLRGISSAKVGLFYIMLMRRMQKGFTLIEILIVVAIIAILASIVLVGLGPTQAAARDSKRLSDLREVQNGLELYFNKCGYYPGGVVSGSCAGTTYSAEDFWGVAGTSATGMTAALTGSNIGVNTVPDDPLGGSHTYYYGTNGGTNYVIAATLENGNNNVFNTYVAPSLTGFTNGLGGKTSGSGVSSCSASSTYCITL